MVTLNEAPEEAELWHLAYRQRFDDPDPGRITIMCGAEVDVLDGAFTTDPQETNCLRCYQEALKRWHI